MRLRARAFGGLTVFISIFMLAPGMAAMAAAAAAAQGSTAATATASASGLNTLDLPELQITITANGFEGVPSTTPAGRYLVTASGSDPYVQVNFLQPTGMPVDDLLHMLQGGSASPASGGGESGTPASGDGGENMTPPAFFYEFLIAGGISILPGQANQATVLDLKPGDWIAWGGSPDATQKPVAFKVTGEMPKDLAEPKANATIGLTDFAINLTDGKLAAGDNIIRLDNKGAQPHFLILMKGPDGMTKDQVKLTVESDMSGTPVAGALDPNKDFMPVISTATQSKGTTTWFTAKLEPGTYAGLCFFPDEKTGMPHAAMGMYNVFTVAK